MIRVLLHLAVACTAAAILSACAAIKPHVSCARPNAAAEKRLLLYGRPGNTREPAFETQRVMAGGRHWTLYTPAGELRHSHSPPVLLLHEMPALSPGALDLARRIACHGYRVYVPLLFGTEGENPNNPLLATRGIGFSASRRWRALAADVERPATREIAALCREYILPRHEGQRLGVVGLCLTGGFPLALLGQDPPVPRLVAPVMSQPSLPFSVNAARRKSLGISRRELDTVHKRFLADPALEILGFRFEGDEVSPGERFVRLGSEFEERFIDGTLKAADYHSRDGLPIRAHAVLTDGYRPWLAGQLEPAGHYAYRELIAFLDKKLKGPSPQRFKPPTFSRTRTSPITSKCDRYGARYCPDDRPRIKLQGRPPR